VRRRCCFRGAWAAGGLGRFLTSSRCCQVLIFCLSTPVTCLEPSQLILPSVLYQALLIHRNTADEQKARLDPIARTQPTRPGALRQHPRTGVLRIGRRPSGRGARHISPRDQRKRRGAGCPAPAAETPHRSVKEVLAAARQLEVGCWSQWARNPLT